MSVATTIDPDTDIVDIANVCSFCDADGVSRYRETYFCQAHLVWFYFALSLEWTD